MPGDHNIFRSPSSCQVKWPSEGHRRKLPTVDNTVAVTKDREDI